MKRLRATVDLYYDMGLGETEEDAIDAINMQIDDINHNYENTDFAVSASEIIKHEIYEEEVE